MVNILHTDLKCSDVSTLDSINLIKNIKNNQIKSGKKINSIYYIDYNYLLLILKRN